MAKGASSGCLDICIGLPKIARLMPETATSDRMEKIVSLCKRRGFIFQSSEIYGGINGFWDYGPLGAELKRNVKTLWWRDMVHLRDDVVGLEATIIMHPQIWKASGHVDTFADMMVECYITKRRFRADQIESQSGTAYHFFGATNRKDYLKLVQDCVTQQQVLSAPEWLKDAIFVKSAIETETRGESAQHFILNEDLDLGRFAEIVAALKRFPGFD